MDEFQCNETFTCQGVGRILYDQTPNPDYRASVLTRAVQVLTNGAYDNYRWRKTVAKLNRKWTHAIALKHPASDERSRLFFYSNRKTIPLTPIITKKDRNDQSANISASAMREVLHQHNRSFLPGGVEFDWDGQFYYLNDPDIADYRCGDATAALKDRTHQWADWIANSSCRQCLFEVDPYCGVIPSLIQSVHLEWRAPALIRAPNFHQRRQLKHLKIIAIILRNEHVLQ